MISAPCIGRCEQAPAAVVGQNPVPMASTERIVAAVRAQEIKHEPAGFIDLASYRAAGGYALLQQCLTGERDVESVIKTLENAGLRGLGGAGFPAGRKWRIVRAEAGPRLMAINIDEGEPGTFKDRTYLERDPHRFLEGMLMQPGQSVSPKFTFTCVTNTTAAATCLSPSWTNCVFRHPCQACRKLICGVAPVRTSAAKNPP